MKRAIGRGPLSTEEAKRFYDHFGAKQDRQAFYEDAALADLIAHAQLPDATAVFEFGCGTGRLAAELLQRHLPAHATYDGVDVSSTMVDLARRRLEPFGDRARIRQIEGSDAFSGLDRRPDRVVTTYVLDLLAEEDIASFIDCCERMLRPEGRLCIASLTFGRTPLSRVVSAAWRGAYAASPRLVGGCRPLRVQPLLSPAAWVVTHHQIITSFGIASEVVIAAKATG